MQLYSTNNPHLLVDLKTAVFQGMPIDNGLFMPRHIPELPPSFFEALPHLSFPELSFEIARHLLQGAIPDADLRGIVERAINFPAPMVQLDENLFVLELFHGPTLAFKDFGARFMAELMRYFLQNESRELVILVATSGDTGGAVAAGFHQKPGIKVVVLYPSGQVSPLQERQFTTLGDNVTALEVAGTFDDCQALVKRAFLDEAVRLAIRLSTANSINIARLIPQIFYYFEGYKQLPRPGAPAVFSVPSGNFGNLTAGLLAQRMGLPVEHFVASTNINDVVPQYLKTGAFTPRPSQSTISSAMDVGNPSNFTRILNLYGSTWNNVQDALTGFDFTDERTREAMRYVEQRYQYTLDPHGAVGYLGVIDYQKQHPDHRGVVLETAHPAKFIEITREVLGHDIPVPERLQRLLQFEKLATPMPVDYMVFRQWLLEHYGSEGA